MSYCYTTPPVLFWNNCGIHLPTARKRDSQGKSLVKKEGDCLFKGYTHLEKWQISSVKSCSL